MDATTSTTYRYVYARSSAGRKTTVWIQYRKHRHAIAHGLIPNGAEHTLLGTLRLSVQKEMLDMMLDNLSRRPVEVIHTDAVHMKHIALATINGTRHQDGIPRHADTVPESIIHEAEGQPGVLGTVKELNECMHKIKTRLVALHPVQCHARGVHHLDVLIVNGEIRAPFQEIGVILAERVDRLPDRHLELVLLVADAAKGRPDGRLLRLVGLGYVATILLAGAVGRQTPRPRATYAIAATGRGHKQEHVPGKSRRHDRPLLPMV
mmetsp:Transcript_17547/g.41503  ORF Transcript_17547/g.41503 Transcript_17547/m.41503 type:complete len:264 (-) Transcript_17547:142-933(-)